MALDLPDSQFTEAALIPDGPRNPLPGTATFRTDVRRWVSAPFTATLGFPSRTHPSISETFRNRAALRGTDTYRPSGISDSLHDSPLPCQFRCRGGAHRARKPAERATHL